MRPKGEPKTAKIVRLPPALIEAVDATIKESFNAYVTRLIQEDLYRESLDAAQERRLTGEGEPV